MDAAYCIKSKLNDNFQKKKKKKRWLFLKAVL